MIPLEPVFPGFLLPVPPPPGSGAGVGPADHPMLLSSPPAALVCRALRLPPELETGDRTPSNISYVQAMEQLRIMRLLFVF